MAIKTLRYIHAPQGQSLPLSLSLFLSLSLYLSLSLSLSVACAPCFLGFISTGLAPGSDAALALPYREQKQRNTQSCLVHMETVGCMEKGGGGGG